MYEYVCTAHAFKMDFFFIVDHLQKKFESYHLNSSWMPQHLVQSLAHSRCLISTGCTNEQMNFIFFLF